MPVIRFSENLILELQKRQMDYSTNILSGAIDSLHEYKWMAGKLYGLRQAEETVRRLYRDMFESKNKEQKDEQPEEREFDF